MAPARTAEAVYAELAERGRVRFRLAAMRRQLDRGCDLIQQAPAHGNPIVFVSGGKDSTALLHLARSVLPDIQGVFVDDGAQTPWTHEVIDELERRYPLQRIQTSRSIPEMLKLVGWGGYQGPERLEGTHHWTPAQWREVLVEEPARRVRDAGYPVQLLGLRAGESRGRLLNRRARGPIYPRANGTTIVTPLCDWSGHDVLDYCALHGLPLSREYLEPGDSERDRRRTAAAHLVDAVGFGSWHHLRERQLGYWQELVADFAEMRREA